MVLPAKEYGLPASQGQGTILKRPGLNTNPFGWYFSGSGFKL